MNIFESALVLNAINDNYFIDRDNMQIKGQICNNFNNKDELKKRNVT